MYHRAVGAGHNGLTCANYLTRMDVNGTLTSNSRFKNILVSLTIVYFFIAMYLRSKRALEVHVH